MCGRNSGAFAKLAPVAASKSPAEGRTASGEPPISASPVGVRRIPSRPRLIWADGDTIGNLRLPSALVLVLVGGVLSGLLMLWLTRRYDFFADEWTYILYARNWTLGQYFVPHNEHWATIPAVTYRVLLLTFGARTYQPYMAVLAIWNLLTAVFLFLIIKRRSGPVPGLAAAAMYLVLGRGWENLIWADQIGFVGSAALGLLAILLLTAPNLPRWRGWAGSAALMAALMTQGPALFFLSWLIVELVLDRNLRPRLLYLLLPVVAYLVWFAIIGHTTVTSTQSPLAVSTWEALLPYVATGIGGSAAGLVGLGVTAAPVAGIVFVGLVGLAWGRRRPAWGIIGAAFGLLAEFVIIGLVRSRYGNADAAAPRYVGIASIFLLVILADAVSRVRWRSPVAATALAVVLIGMVGSGIYLHQAERARYLKNILPSQVSQQVAWAYRDSPGLNARRPVDPLWLPGYNVRSYIAARKVQGSPLPNLAPGQLTRYPAPLLDRSMANLFPPDVTVRTASSAEVCTRESLAGFQLPAGASATFRSSNAGAIAVQVWHYGPIPDYAIATRTLRSGDQVLTVRTGVPRPGFVWFVRVVGTPYSVVSICSSP